MILVAVTLSDVETAQDVNMQLHELLLTEATIPLGVPLQNGVERSRVVSINGSGDSVTSNQVLVLYADNAIGNIMGHVSMETIVQRELLLVLISTLLILHVAKEEVGFQILSIALQDCLYCYG